VRRAAVRAATRAVVGLVLLALGSAALLHGPARDGAVAGPQLELTSSGDVFTQSNSRDGQPVFTVAGLGPGGSTGGEVTLSNTGTLAGRFTLSAAEVTDVPGAGGGILSQRLRLTVTDVTATTQPLAVYEGGLAAMSPRDLGVFAPGEARSFELVASLPDGGDPTGPAAGDNAFQGAQASVTYVWDAHEEVADEEPPPVDEPAPPGPPSDPPPSEPATDRPPAAEQSPRPGDRQPPRVRVDVPRIQRIYAGGLLRIRLHSDERATAVVRGWLRADGRRLRLPRSRMRLRAGQTRLLRVRVPARHREAMRRALIAGRGAALRIVITVTDRSGNRTVVKRTLHVRAG
jgi:spore coat-associated protein N